MTVAKKRRRKKPSGPLALLRRALSKIVALPRDLIRKSKARHAAIEAADTKRVMKLKKRKKKPRATKRRAS
jgi:hypothetical protein